jgi:predicted metal-dependent peptidase
MGPLVVAIDTSGSVDDVLLGQCACEVNAIIDDVAPERVTILYADTHVRRADVYERGETVEVHHVGGGGTDFRPVFDYVAADPDGPPAALVYLTDLDGDFPEHAPEYPVLWAAPYPRYVAGAPFGDVVDVTT